MKIATPKMKKTKASASKKHTDLLSTCLLPCPYTLNILHFTKQWFHVYCFLQNVLKNQVGVYSWVITFLTYQSL